MNTLTSYYPAPVVAGTSPGTYAEGNASRIIDVTHAELLSLMGSQTLKRGFHYRITDFVTEYMSNDEEWISPSNTANVSKNNGTAFTVSSIAATPEPLVVYAFSSSNVSPQAYSDLYPDDIIHYDPSLTYLDGTHTAKGFIVYRKEPARSIEMDYDWRNIKFKMWALDPAQGDSPILPFQNGNSYQIGDFVTGTVATTSLILQCVTPTTSAPSGHYELNADAVGDWRPVWSSNMLSFSPYFDRQVGPKSTSVVVAGGGASRAHYLPTLSSTLLSALSSQSDTSGQFHNIRVERAFGSAPNTSAYSKCIPAVVLFRGINNNRLTDISVKSSSHIFLRCGIETLPSMMFNVSIYNSSYIYAHLRISSPGNSASLHVDDCSNIIFPSSSNIGGYGNCRISASSQSVLYTQFYQSVYETSASFTGVRYCCSLLGYSTGEYRNLFNCGISAKGNYNTFYGGVGRPLISRRTHYGAPTSMISAATHTMDVAGYPVCVYNSVTGSQVSFPYYSDAQLLTKHATSQIISRCASVPDIPPTLPLFSVKNDTTSSYTRNTSSWLGNLASQLTGCSVWNSVHGVQRAGVAITPRHVLFAKHWPLQTGCTLRFVTADNQVVERTVLRVLLHTTTPGPAWVPDAGLALLDSPLPAGISTLKVFPYSGVLKCPGPDTWRSCGFWVNSDRKACITSINGEYGGAYSSTIPFSPADPDEARGFYSAAVDANTKAFYSAVLPGESGSPLFWVLNDEVSLVGLAYQAPTPSNTMPGSMHAIWMGEPNMSPSLNQMIADIDSAQGAATGYTTTYTDVSAFANVT